ncbi:MAG: VWA domain-containing protein [Melioribacteraceae bacterium]|nr:VWA domain-containing protein [Melioribacteraceae bacterium]
MIRFENPEILYLLLVIPFLVLLYLLNRKKQKEVLNVFISENLQKEIIPEKNNFKEMLKFIILMIALTFTIVGVANPRIGTKIEEAKQVGIDVYILLDVSRSMAAEDIKPNRLEKAKFEISKLMQRLNGDRIGLIVFAGQAFIQFPLTSDYSAANLFLNAVDFNTVPQPGTNIGDALDLALRSFKYEDPTNKAIVIITDGEDHEGNIDEPLKEANSKNVSIYAIGLGSTAGTPIPIYNEDGVQIGYKKDNQGEIVLTKLDEETLKKITEQGNGKYYRGTNSEDELDKIYNDLAKIQESEYGSKRITDYEDKFYWFLIPAIFLLLIEFRITSKKTKWIVKLEELRKGEIR